MERKKTELMEAREMKKGKEVYGKLDVSNCIRDADVLSLF